MPVMKCSNGKWKIGEHGLCEYDTEETADKAYKGYLGHKHEGQMDAEVTTIQACATDDARAFEEALKREGFYDVVMGYDAEGVRGAANFGDQTIGATDRRFFNIVKPRGGDVVVREMKDGAWVKVAARDLHVEVRSLFDQAGGTPHEYVISDMWAAFCNKHGVDPVPTKEHCKQLREWIDEEFLAPAQALLNGHTAGVDMKCPGCYESLGKPGEFFYPEDTRTCPNCLLILKRDGNDCVSTGEYKKLGNEGKTSMNKTSQADQPKIGSPYKLQNGHTIKVVDLEQSGVLFQLLLPGGVWQEPVDQCTWDEWNQMMPEKLGIEGKLAQGESYFAEGDWNVGDELENEMGETCKIVGIEEKDGERFLKLEGTCFMGGKYTENWMSAYSHWKKKATHTASSKVAVDQDTKEYFTSYFKAYGASLTRDLALKKMAKVAHGVVFVKDVADLGVQSGDKFSIVPSSDPEQVILYGDIANRSGMDGIPLSKSKLQEYETLGLTLDASKQALSSRQGTVVKHHGEWFVKDSSNPAGTDEYFYLQDQSAGPGLKFHVVGFEINENDEAVDVADQGMDDKYASKQAQHEDLAKTRGWANDAYNAWTRALLEENKENANQAYEEIQGYINQYGIEPEIFADNAQARKQFSQYDPTTGMLSKTSQVVEVPNEWAQIAEAVWECDYASGAHGTVEKQGIKYLATFIDSDGTDHVASDLDSLEQAEGFCDKLAQPHQNVVAKSATQKLKALQAGEKLQALVAERTALGQTMENFKGEGCENYDDAKDVCLDVKASGILKYSDLEPLIGQARAAMRIGRKLTAITKMAVDAETIAYWSEYFGQYGTQFVRPLTFKKAARMALIAGDWDADDMAWYEAQLKKETEELKDKSEEKTAQNVEGAQTMYDVAVSVLAEPFVTLLPDAFEQTLKFALEAIKPQETASVSVDHVLADVTGQSMKGNASCAVSMTGTDMAAFIATAESQLKAFMQEADFPCATVKVSAPVKRVAGQGCIVRDCRDGVSHVVLVARYGAERALAARKAHQAQQSAKFSPRGRFLAKHAQAMIESADAIKFEGDASGEHGAWADLGEGVKGQIKYVGTQLPKGFQWMITDGGEQVLDRGEQEMFEQAVGEVQAKLPDAKSKLEAKDAALKVALRAELGPVADFRRLASVGGVEEYNVTLKSGKVAWVTVRAGKVENKVGEV